MNEIGFFPLVSEMKDAVRPEDAAHTNPEVNLHGIRRNEQVQQGSS